jgi:hypothetical protein
MFPRRNSTYVDVDDTEKVRGLYLVVKVCSMRYKRQTPEVVVVCDTTETKPAYESYCGDQMSDLCFIVLCKEHTADTAYKYTGMS